jgi:exosome complex exonuclease RRP6
LCVRRQAQLTAGRERLYSPLHATLCTWVDSEPLLQQTLTRLAAASEIAIDLESHSYRSYRGFVCLMQISTREEDFLIDAIELRSSLHVLNEVFTDSRITKVMHGADSDINWLQRDFGLYIVGLFDTGQAARVLEFQSFALAHLLKHYCGVTANKAFQMADWRMRPLTEEMLTCVSAPRACPAPHSPKARSNQKLWPTCADTCCPQVCP